jgi:UDP-sulfoquinovose synthase
MHFLFARRGQSASSTDEETMRIAILRGDGYCGWATALHLSSRGHEIAIVDNFMRRQWDHEIGVQALTPIRLLSERLAVWEARRGNRIKPFVGDVTDYEFLSATLSTFGPEAIVHFAEQRSVQQKVAFLNRQARLEGSVLFF